MFDDLPAKKTKADFPRVLTDMSIGELRSYIEELKAEISRTEDDIQRKQASRDAAASIFKS
ncbi:MAG: DUF1192 domain-containing protein [Alphaproteobacteria bacterium]|nr:DUF1192 domain-containing protein [Alphaproteobacteria bacterium]